jgi:hypothetical protein
MVNTNVTAFMSNINKTRPIEVYLEYGKKLLAIYIDQIIFIERVIYDLYFSLGEPIFQFNYEGKQYDYVTHDKKTFVFFKKNDIYLYDYTVTNFHVKTDNPVKDTLEYMFIQCHKTEWLKMAAALNNKDSYIWVDFGIYHMIRNETILHNELERVINQPMQQIRIASCIDVHRPNTKDIYTQVVWYFAGSVFGGPTPLVIEFANKMKQTCISIIKEKHTLMWEINVWYLIYLKNPELFDSYLCNHDVSILTSF